jgi:hypothetical protein
MIAIQEGHEAFSQYSSILLWKRESIAFLLLADTLPPDRCYLYVHGLICILNKEKLSRLSKKTPAHPFSCSLLVPGSSFQA